MTDVPTPINLAPPPEAPCPCGSKQPFGQCCGSPQRQGPPRGIVVRHQVLSDKQCRDIVQYLNKQPKTWLTVGAKANTFQSVNARRDPHRVTQTMRLGKWATKIDRLLAQHAGEIIRDQFGQTLEWLEKPQTLYYSEGGHYFTHADSEIRRPGSDKWDKIIDRDYSILCYINDDFTGGDIRFNNFDWAYSPQKGDLVCFPSDHGYVHTAEMVTSGYRYAVVSWCAVREAAKLKPAAPDNAIRIT